MSSRKRKARSAVSVFVRNQRAELGTLSSQKKGGIDTQDIEIPALYPPRKVTFKYPSLSPEQAELVSISRSFLGKALNSPYYQYFRKSINPHILLETRRSYATQFMKSLVHQRPHAFPKELHSKKIKLDEEEELKNVPIFEENEESEKENEEDNEKEAEEEEEAEEEIEDDEMGMKGLWEDGNESESGGSEASI
ncbi:unnamed protein product [Blepharisma stoltei]|uniref:Uncharacterized protein n=1 Tax=Blepharisma stoltei TaxID=1481888 RepID=A0AAU9K644_9CILI|nr:unnamed protein product [Blepharisma stoltei]